MPGTILGLGGKIVNNTKSLPSGLFTCAQLCLSLCDPMDCGLPGSSVHGILQARILEWVAISSPRASPWSRDWTCISCMVGGFFTSQSAGKPLTHPSLLLMGARDKKQCEDNSAMEKVKALQEKPEVPGLGVGVVLLCFGSFLHGIYFSIFLFFIFTLRVDFS